MDASATQTASRTFLTVFSGIGQLLPRLTPSPTPTAAAIAISTTVVVPDFNRFYHIPISAFQPVYLALPDGSLTTVPFMDDLARSYLSLLVTAMLASLFLRNIVVSCDYFRRATMKRRTLFILLLCSQLLSLGLAPLLASYFSRNLNCTAVLSVSSTATGISLALLMSGVLGLKAYRCLDSSRFVLVVLAGFFCASTALLGLQLTSLRGVHRLSGGCASVFLTQRFIRAYVLVQLGHSFFICCCFLYAVWISRASPAVRGRLSVRVTLVDFPDVEFDKPTQRVWWKQLLGLGGSALKLPALDLSNGADHRGSSSDAQYSSSSRVSRSRRPGASDAFTFSRRRVSDPILEQPLNPVAETREPGAPYRRPASLSRLIPRMELFHQVMKDELCYTTTITGTTVILAFLLVCGVNFKNSLDMTGWVAANWAIISVLVIHSFGRVIRRHETEALVQHPSAWWPERDINHRSPYARRPFPPSQLRVQLPEDPFSDARAVRESMTSWNSGSPSSPSPIASTRDRRLSLPSPFSDIPSHRNTIVDTDPFLSPRRLSGTSFEEKNVKYG
ncbi:hypothetical protein B0H16DRAFT_17640 [Mycena metata]|uniref:Uncharacterized protein n=1 Tax=Mycena metata TaxID=1033252 RepID=A0AAD7KI45_9AGAR|nr:hypothetical protein B0H16DRAFT_17640 [Mycena metata]